MRVMRYCQRKVAGCTEFDIGWSVTWHQVTVMLFWCYMNVGNLEILGVEKYFCNENSYLYSLFLLTFRHIHTISMNAAIRIYETTLRQIIKLGEEPQVNFISNEIYYDAKTRTLINLLTTWLQMNYISVTILLVKSSSNQFIKLA